MKLDPLPRFVPLDRTVALSDAVFAVVLTLLVLGIEVPEGESFSGPELPSVLEKLWHQVFVYLVSFVIVAMYWSQHSLLFGGLKRLDRASAVLNLVFLSPVTLLPFVTQLLGGWRDDWRAVVVFALTNALAAVVFLGLSKRVASRPEMHKGPQTAMLARRITLGLRVFVGLTGVGVLVGLINVKAGMLCFVLTPIVHFYDYVRDPLGSDEEPTSNESAG